MPNWVSVAIPLGQGQVFNNFFAIGLLGFAVSQSLWVRDRFLMLVVGWLLAIVGVAIPLGQGQVFNR